MTTTVWDWLDYCRGAGPDPRLTDPEATRAYDAFLVNRGLSYDRGSVLRANLMNRYPQLDPAAAAAYLRATAGKPGRRGRWAKPRRDDDRAAVQRALNCGRGAAAGALRCMRDDQLAELRAAVGGLE